MSQHQSSQVGLLACLLRKPYARSGLVTDEMVPLGPSTLNAIGSAADEIKRSVPVLAAWKGNLQIGFWSRRFGELV